MEFKDYYAVLGVPKTAETADIKRAYRKLARQYHPDVSKEPNAEDKFKEVNEAWEVLQDPKKRAHYDQLSAGGWQGGQGGQGRQQHPFGGGGGFHRQGSQGFSSADGEDFSEFFNSIFGGMPGGMPGGFAQAGGRARRQQPFRQNGRDLHTKIQIPIKTAYEGGVQTITLQVPTNTPDGRMTTQNKQLKIKIPAGVIDGSQIRLKGQGGEGMQGGQNGDLYIEMTVNPDPVFTLVQHDIHVKLPITPWEAALGASVSVPTLGGTVNLKVPAGAKSNQQLRLKGRGMPGKQTGDQYVILEIMNPPVKSEQDKAVFEEMAQKMPFNPRETLGV